MQALLLQNTVAAQDAMAGAAQTMAKRGLIQQALKAGATGATAGAASPAASAEVPSAAKQAQKLQAQLDAKPGDGFGALDKNKPLVANKTLIGSTVNPNELSKTQLYEIGHNQAAPVTLPPLGAQSKAINSTQSRAILNQIAEIRGTPIESIAAKSGKVSTTQPASAKGASQAKEKAPAAGFKKGALSQKSLAAGTSSTLLGTLGASAQPDAQNIDASIPSTLDAAAPNNSTLDATEAAEAGATASSTPTKNKDAAAYATQAVRAEAVKKGDASVGANHGTDASFDKALTDAWAAVDKAGEKRTYLTPVNWQAFFNLLAAKNAKLIGMFIELQQQATQLENQTSIQSLKLDKDITETGQQFARIQSMLALARDMSNLRDLKTENANRSLFNQSPFLSSTELDLKAGLGNRQMQAPIQRTFQHSFVHELAGDPTYKPLLADTTETSDMKDFRTQKYVELKAQNSELSDAQIHAKAVEFYSGRKYPPEKAEAKDGPIKILTKYTTTIDGKTVDVPIARNVLGAKEQAGLTEEDLTRYNSVMQRVHNTMQGDLPAQAEMYLAEIQTLQSAAAKTTDPIQKENLLAMAKDIHKTHYQPAIENVRGLADVMGHTERRYDDAMRNRGALEGIRRNAEEELEKSQTAVDKPDAPPQAQHKAMAQKAVYQSMVNIINRKCAIIDDNMLRYFDSKIDNRRARFQTGAQAIAQDYRENRDGVKSNLNVASDPNATNPVKKKAAAKAEELATRNAIFNSYPPHFKNPVILHEELLERIKTHQGASDAPLSIDHPLFKQYEDAIRAQNGQDGVNKLSLEGVSKTRMITHVKERGEELANQTTPDAQAEKAALATMDSFWRKTELWPNGGGYAPPQTTAETPKIKERNVARDVAKPEEISNAPTEHYWSNADGTRGAQVDFSDPEQTRRYYKARAATGGQVFGMQNEVAPGGGGAYRNNTGFHIDHMRNTLSNFAQNTSSVETLQQFASDSAVNLSSDAQESLSDFMSLLSQARQQTNGLVAQMYQMANAKVGR
ncbi:hypothetical protein Q3G72_032167 [Acer saccharum]|nr:hypothetical protein Q3G72_032167 [Acer saccharum]